MIVKIFSIVRVRAVHSYTWGENAREAPRLKNKIKKKSIAFLKLGYARIGPEIKKNLKSYTHHTTTSLIRILNRARRKCSLRA